MHWTDLNELSKERSTFSPLKRLYKQLANLLGIVS